MFWPLGELCWGGTGCENQRLSAVVVIDHSNLFTQKVKEANLQIEQGVIVPKTSKDQKEIVSDRLSNCSTSTDTLGSSISLHARNHKITSNV